MRTAQRNERKAAFPLPIPAVVEEGVPLLLFLCGRRSHTKVKEFYSIDRWLLCCGVPLPSSFLSLPPCGS
jgi:hypothetical protein